jgi:hypothetical protein
MLRVEDPCPLTSMILAWSTLGISGGHNSRALFLADPFLEWHLRTLTFLQIWILVELPTMIDVNAVGALTVWNLILANKRSLRYAECLVVGVRFSQFHSQCNLAPRILPSSFWVGTRPHWPHHQ